MSTMPWDKRLRDHIPALSALLEASVPAQRTRNPPFTREYSYSLVATMTRVTLVKICACATGEQPIRAICVAYTLNV